MLEVNAFILGVLPVAGDRKVVWTFDGPEVAHEDMDFPEDGWRWRIVVSARHDARTKSFVATIRRSQFVRRDGYAMERTDVFGPDNGVIQHLGGIARYSDKALAQFASTVAQKANATAANADQDGAPVGRLLLEAASWDNAGEALRLATAR